MKKICAVLLAAVICLCLFGCDNSETNVNYDANIIADTYNSQLSFGEQLEKSTADALYSIYGIDSSLCTDAAFYTNSGAVADEIAVFNCVDGAALEKVNEAIAAHVKYLVEGYSSYGPDQVPKIEKYSVITKGNTVAFCICENPDSAAEIFETAIESITSEK